MSVAYILDLDSLGTGGHCTVALPPLLVPLPLAASHTLRTATAMVPPGTFLRPAPQAMFLSVPAFPTFEC